MAKRILKRALLKKINIELFLSLKKKFPLKVSLNNLFCD